MTRLLLLASAALTFGAGCATAPQRAHAWQSPLRQDHPLAGRIWDTRQGAFISGAELERAVREADFVLLGETHDNPDHHLLQARLVRAAAKDGRKPAVAFEMLDVPMQAQVDGALREAPNDPDAVARAVSWDQSGWPAFALYRPIFEAGLEAGLPIVAANVPRARLRQVMHHGLQAVDPALRDRLSREPPLGDEVLAALAEEMRIAHCGHLPGGMMEGFVLAQRLRDAQMSLRMVDAGGEAGALLIAGSGHVRKDRGVPTWLDDDARGRSVLSVTFREVTEGLDTPEALGPLPYDLVYFTPAMEREDPCEKLRERLRNHPPVKAPPPPEGEVVNPPPSAG